MGHEKLHAAEHVDGTDDIQSATASQKGLMTSTFAGKLNGIATGADVTGSNTPQDHASLHVDGNDDIQLATSIQKGIMSSTYAGKLDGIDAGADVTADNAPKAHGLGGSSHTADTLANLNAKVTGATLGDVSALETTMDTKDSSAISTHSGAADPHSGYQKESEKSAANGYASLDGSGKVPTSELPSSVIGGVNYQGAWNATTNIPTLTSATGTQGHYYVVSVAGSTNLDGITDWKIGDWAIYNGSAWEKVDNTESVTSVFTRTGAVVAAQDDYTHAQLATIGADDHHAQSHYMDHAENGTDELLVEDLGTGEVTAFGNLFSTNGTGGVDIKQIIYSQTTAPAPGQLGDWMFWEDTTNNKLYLVAYGNTITKMVELA